MKPPVFILGTQRSGTTLLTRILSAHKKIFTQNEINLSKVFGRGFDKDKIVNEIAGYIQQHVGVSIADLVAEDAEFVWGVKDPRLTFYLDDLRQFLGHTRFIIIVRDGRGVTNSYMENKWGLGTNAYTGAIRWASEVRQHEEFMARAPDQFLCIRYEDLVGDLENTIRKVCEHMGVGFDESVLDYHKKKSYYRVRRENINTHGKPNRELTVKWKQKLNDRQIALIEHVAGDTLKKYGYDLTMPPITPSRLEILYYQWHQKIVGGIQLQYRWEKAKLERWMRNR